MVCKLGASYALIASVLFSVCPVIGAFGTGIPPIAVNRRLRGVNNGMWKQQQYHGVGDNVIQNMGPEV